MEILRTAILKPLWQIAENAGVSGSIVVQEVLEQKGNAGYNAATGKYSSDLIKEGVVDPKKVTRAALQNAASASAMLLTTEVVIADLPKKDMPAGGLGGMPHEEY